MSWGEGAFLHTYYVLDIFIRPQLIMIKALQGWHHKLSFAGWTYLRGLLGRKWWIESLSPFQLTQTSVLLLLDRAEHWVRGTEEVGCRGGLPGKEADAVKGPEPPRWTWWEHMCWWSGCVPWDRSKCKLDILCKVKTKGPPYSKGGRSSKGFSFPPASVSDAHLLLHAKIQLFFFWV